MSMIPDEIIEQVRDSADLVSIVGESVELKRTGGDYRGPCPFHGGQHRNFAVIPRKNRYYCFVCKASGDVFSWYMNKLGLDYPSAVREVARSLGIQVPEHTTRQGPDPREPLYQAVSVAHDWFGRQLRETPEAEPARAYLANRGIEPEQIEVLELGYAPRNTAFPVAMAKLGLDEQLLLEAGLLATRHDGKIIPRFRDRLLFPIHDIRAKVVGFGGRLLGPGEPKYLNSPESEIFHKGKTLYNLHSARNAIRKEERAIVVEGYFDVIRLVLAGAENVVAPLGTALTPDQAMLLKRYAPVATLLFDSDAAGLKATFRAGDELLRNGVRVRVATMPEGQDPDTLVQSGGLEALNSVLDDSLDVLERKIQILEGKGWFRDIEHQREALDRLLPTIHATADPLQRELYITLVSSSSKVRREVIEQELARSTKDIRVEVSSKESISKAGQQHRLSLPKRWASSPEKAVLSLMVLSAEWRNRAPQLIKREWFGSEEAGQVFDFLIAFSEGGTAVPSESADSPSVWLWRGLLQETTSNDISLLESKFVDEVRKIELHHLLGRYEKLVANSKKLDLSRDERDLAMQAVSEMKAQLNRDFPVEFRGRWYGRHGRAKSSKGNTRNQLQ